jgi:hypothetical protein
MENSAALAYLTQVRAFTPEKIKKFKLGFKDGAITIPHHRDGYASTSNPGSSNRLGEIDIFGRRAAKGKNPQPPSLPSFKPGTSSPEGRWSNQQPTRKYFSDGFFFCLTNFSN